VGLGYYQPGYAVAKPIARVLLGESPATIPIENVIEKQVFLDEALARQFGLTFPPALKAEAARQSAPQGGETPAPPADASVPPTGAAAAARLSRLATLDPAEDLATPGTAIRSLGIGIAEGFFQPAKSAH
jgi:hypothetical protein